MLAHACRADHARLTCENANNFPASSRNQLSSSQHLLARDGAPYIADRSRSLVKIVHYPHPALRYPSKPLRRVDRWIGDTVGQMFELMYEHRGVGLAANQVNLPFQLFVVNTSGERSQGEELVFINPVLQRPKGHVEAEEGCLSLPELFGKVVRSESVHVSAYNLQGQPFEQVVDGMLARVIQHEFDHVQGVLIVDRFHEFERRDATDIMERLERDYLRQLEGERASQEAAIKARLDELVQQYCA
jgi:peptide deformylase